MAFLREHDLVVADGTFRVVMTPKKRIVAVLDVHESMLGPLHLAFEIDRAGYLPPHVPASVLHESMVTAGLFDDVGHFVNKAAGATFNAASHAASAIASPTIDLAKSAAAHGVHILGDLGHPLEQAAHVVMRAKLGDLNAKQFIKTMVSAAKDGVHAATHVADTLLDASKLVARAMDVPTLLTSHIPVLGDIMKKLSPYEVYQKMVTSLQHGDFKAIKKLVDEEASLAESVISLVPGVGTGISTALSAGLAALESGNPIEVAIKAAYGAIPIPPGIRQITDTVLDAVLSFLEHPHNLTDVVIQIARDKVPSGLPRDVFDTLVQLVVKHVPIQKAAGQLVEHYISQYVPAFGGQKLDEALHGLHVDAGAMLSRAANGVHLPTTLSSAPARMIQPFHLLQAAHG